MPLHLSFEGLFQFLVPEKMVKYTTILVLALLYNTALKIFQKKRLMDLASTKLIEVWVDLWGQKKMVRAVYGWRTVREVEVELAERWR